jgi:uncharacterized protein (DUF1800 family)
VSHRLHPSFFVRKLWSYFVPTEPDGATQAALERLYRTDKQVRPVLQAILMHPVLYDGPRMTKPPVVHIASLMRRIGAPVTTTAWAWIGSLSGQQLFYPPDVGGWDDTRWLDTATFRGRWLGVQQLLRTRTLDPRKSTAADAPAVLRRALKFWNEPTLSEPTRRALLRFAEAALADADERWKKAQYPALVENALRQLIAVSPDVQTS